jgi:hypothetical protein
MSAGYPVGLRNGLLETKHLEAIGNAIWLYLWLLDKQPKGTDKVLGGQPVNYELFKASINVSRRTYTYWLTCLKNTGYITILRTPYGQIITIQKPKKWARDAQQTAQPDAQDLAKEGGEMRKELHTDAQDLAERCATNAERNIKETIIHNNINNNTRDEVPENKISVLYYKVIKQYKLPVVNHKTLNAKIKQMELEDTRERIINYLNFLLTQYEKISLDYKPQINTALDIYGKRIQISNAIKSEVNNKPKVWRAKA